MNAAERKKHWENIFKTKDTKQVSWFQTVPKTSLTLIKKLNLSSTADIIDVGCGDSCLPEFLLDHGYKNISAIDISATAIKNSKNKMGDKSLLVNWIVADVTDFSSSQKYDLWHDRAVFHFLTDKKDIESYIKTTTEKLKQNGILIIGTFSENGPEKCSGLDIKQYSEEELSNLFDKDFNKIESFTKNHKTPSGSIQNFLFCVFKKK